MATSACFRVVYSRGAVNSAVWFDIREIVMVVGGVLVTGW